MSILVVKEQEAKRKNYTMHVNVQMYVKVQCLIEC